MFTYRQRREVLLHLYHAQLASTTDAAFRWVARAKSRCGDAPDIARIIDAIDNTLSTEEFARRLEVVTAVLEIDQAIAAQDRGAPCAASVRMLRKAEGSRTLQL